MKKKKNKKLKRQFKELLEKQLKAHLKNGLDIPKPEVTLNEKPKKEESRSENYVKTDLKKTLYITLFISSLMVFLYFYLQISGETLNIAKYLLRLLGS